MMAIGMGVSNYWEASDQALESVEEKLDAVLTSREAALKDYLLSIEQDLRYTASNPAVLAALEEFRAGWEALGSDQTERLQRLYITENPENIGEKHLYDAADDGSDYSAAHARYHPWFRQFLTERGYYDVFLFDGDGNLVYSVFKEADFATNVNSGEWKESDLGNAFRAALSAGRAGAISFFDFEPYAPSNGAPASFIATPILQTNGELSGVLVFQMPIDRINAVMGVSAGLGESGQAYIVGADRLMRSQSRHETESSTILTKEVANEATFGALEGKNGVVQTTGANGETVLAAFHHFTFEGVTWALVAEEDLSEIMAPVVEMRNNMLAIAAAALLVVGFLGVSLARGMVRPINRMTRVMTALANGDTDQEVPSTGRSDEIGEMAQALLVFKENAGEVERMKAEEDARKARQEEALKSELLRIADALDQEVKAAVSDTNSQAEGMKHNASEMNAIISRLSNRTSVVAQGADQASGSIQTVASATEQLSASISEITRQVGQSSSIAQAAAQEALKTDKTVGGLAEAAQKIGDVIDIIQDIAEQTNLLALNATIEAARAGEMGKGFAVVASEVKNLANQTAKATEEIGSQIGAIRSETEGAVDAIRSISETIRQINEISESITEAVGQQSQATGEISASVQNTVQHMTEVSSQVSDVAGETDQVSRHSGSVMENAENTSSNIDQLDTRMGEALRELRESAVGNRRQDDRLIGTWQGRVIAAGRSADCQIGNISLGGALLQGFDGLATGETATLRINGLDGDIPASVVVVSGQGTHLKFHIDAAFKAKLEQFLEPVVSRIAS